MSNKSARQIYRCHRCPTPAKPLNIDSTAVIRQQSAKMRLAQLLKIKGASSPANHHTANLPGTKRMVIPTPPGQYSWPCSSNIQVKNPPL